MSGRRTKWIVIACIAGVSGFTVGRWWGREAPTDSPASPRPDADWAGRWGGRVDAAVGVAADGFRYVERRWRSSRPVDESDLVRALADLDGTRRLQTRVLGDGVVELVGEASDAVARATRDAVERVPGVRVAVSRIWTPASMQAGQIDGLPGFE